MESNNKVNVIAIDGPAGSGKSTVSRLLADRLGYLYVDTGAMYRALTLKAMREKTEFKNEERIVALTSGASIKLVKTKDNDIVVLLDGADVSGDIRDMSVSANVKHVARIKGVRSNMVKMQRKMLEGSGGIVMEGRDIGTIVFPDAKLKIYLDASFGERVKRRYDELMERGVKTSRENVAKDLKSRDYTDQTRKEGPLKKAQDAIILDTTSLSIDEVVGKILEYAREKR